MTVLLKEVGLEIGEILDGDTFCEITDTSERIFIVAREYRKLQKAGK